MILKVEGQCHYQPPADVTSSGRFLNPVRTRTHRRGSFDHSVPQIASIQIDGQDLVDLVANAEPEGRVSVFFPGHRFEGEIKYSTATSYPKVEPAVLLVDGEDVLAALRQYEGKRIWFWLADKPLSAMQLTVLGFRYASAYPRPLTREDFTLPIVESSDWENAFQCFSEALLLERNNAELIGLFVSSVLATDRLNDYGPVLLVQMLNRAIELDTEDTVILDTRATLFDFIGETDRAAEDRARMERIRQAEEDVMSEKIP